jgi:hypothetical protein
MPSQAELANLYQLYREVASVYTLVPEVFDVTPGTAESPDIDVTHLGSTAREIKPGLPNFGTFSFRMNHILNNAVQEAIEAASPQTAFGNWRFMDPTNTYGLQYSLAIATYNYEGLTVDGKIVAVVTLKQSGKPTRVGNF